MGYPLNLVLENLEYLWSYLTFWVVIVDGDLNYLSFQFIPLSCFRNDQKYIKSLFEVPFVFHFPPYLQQKKWSKNFQHSH